MSGTKNDGKPATDWKAIAGELVNALILCSDMFDMNRVINCASEEADKLADCQIAMESALARWKQANE